MPRSLEEVAKFYLPEPPGTPAQADEKFRSASPVALPLLTLPVAGHDALRAAFAWNLTVELARLGALATLVAPRDPEVAALWPEPGRGPLGARAEFAAAQDAQGLVRAALDAAVAGALEAADGGLVVLAVPPAWLCAAGGTRSLWRWVLLWATPDPADLCEAYGLAKLAVARGPDPQLGLVVHGVRRRPDAEAAFAKVANLSARQLGRAPVSYGLLADDLHVYRAITARRPIGLEHPQSRAARALRDVAGMIWDDARKRRLA